jgi:hypothetical protein
MEKTNKNLNSFNAQIVAGALLVKESRQVAKLLLQGAKEEDWYHFLVVENVLQKKSPATTKRMVSLIKNRLSLMQPELWKLVANGNSDVATQALLAAAIKHSRLLGEFIQRVVKQNLRVFNRQLDKRDWNIFIEECQQIDEEVANWSESTRNKLGQVVFRILAEARYVDSTRSLRIIPVMLIPEVKRYLIKNNEEYVLSCMEFNQ